MSALQVHSVKIETVNDSLVLGTQCTVNTGTGNDCVKSAKDRNCDENIWSRYTQCKHYVV